MAISGNMIIEVHEEKVVPVKSLKQLLFEEAAFQHEEYAENKKVLGKTHPRTIAAYSEFLCCLRLIIHAGLDDEYSKWEIQREEHVNDRS